VTTEQLVNDSDPISLLLGGKALLEHPDRAVRE
jgi:hypothetical protein